MDNTEEEVYYAFPIVGARARNQGHAKAAKIAKADAVLACAEDPGDVTPEMVRAAIACAMLETGIRGPCIRCGEPVTWSNGLRDWFAELVHITCPAPAPETAREPVGTCPHCRFTVFADSAVQTGAGVFMHAVCARAGR